MKANQLKSMIPNFLTIMNMTLGIGAIFLLLRPGTKQTKLFCAGLILTGALIDALDGRFARRLNAVTNMGKQLDSFADLITFGLAPLALLYAAGLLRTGFAVPLCAWAYPVAGAYRLARYNLGDFNNYFTGLPITAAGIILTLYAAAFLLLPNLFALVNPSTTSCLLAVLSLMMVSRFKIPRSFWSSRSR